MTVHLDVYDVTDTTFLGTLQEAYGIGGFADVEVPGMLRFRIDIASTDDLGLLQPRRVVRVREGASEGVDDREAFIVQDRPADLVADIEPEPGKKLTVVEFRCPHLLTWMGYAQGGGVLEPEGGIDGEQVNPRPFGWHLLEFDDLEHPEPIGFGAGGGPAGFPDPSAERIGGTSDHVLLRRILEVAAVGKQGPFRGYVTSNADDWTFEVAGRRVSGGTWDGGRAHEFSGTLGDREVIVADLKREAGSPWLKVTMFNPDTNNVIYRSFTTAVWGAGDPERWEMIDGPLQTPGTTPGGVMTVALDESQARGELIQVGRGTWDGDVDENGSPWDRTIVHDFRVQNLGHLLDELQGWRCEAEMTPDGILKLYNQRGIDRTATVTVTAPYGLSLTGRGVQATRLLYETEGGFGRAQNAVAESGLGVVMASVAQFGTSPGPDELGQPVLDQLLSDSTLENELEVLLPDDIVPYVDVFCGDLVTCVSVLDGTEGPVRLMSFAFEVDGAGNVEWSATGVPQ